VAVVFRRLNTGGRLWFRVEGDSRTRCDFAPWGHLAITARTLQLGTCSAEVVMCALVIQRPFPPAGLVGRAGRGCGAKRWMTVWIRSRTGWVANGFGQPVASLLHRSRKRWLCQKSTRGVSAMTVSNCSQNGAFRVEEYQSSKALSLSPISAAGSPESKA
jgi:hypothetical protein